MSIRVNRSQIALAVSAALGVVAMCNAPGTTGAGKVQGKYVAGDFHNHTTCSDGSISMQKLVRKATDKVDTPWGLDWFVQAGHGGNGNRNCTLVEDATLATPAYPFTAGMGPTTTWQNTNPPVQVKGLVSGSPPNQNMWRWQSIQEFQYPLIEYLNAFLNKPLFIGVESVVPGHEHSSMSVITGQIPNSLDNAQLPGAPGYLPLGNATALAQWEYCFDRGDTDTSRGNTTTSSGIGNNWDCSVTGSLNAADPSWSAAAKKLIPSGGTGTGTKGHLKTVEAMKWMAQNHPDTSYYVPAHLERAGPFFPDGNQGFNIEHLRNFNNAAPKVAFGMETQPGHGASSNRGEYQVKRNNFGGTIGLVDSVGGTTYGGTGVYGAQIGGVWDALLGEGRNYWFFASSDWHNRGSFGPDDRRTTQDFYPGEYQRTYTMVRNGADPKIRPQMIVDGLRTGNAFAASGQLIDRLAFVACSANPTPAEAAANLSVQERAVALARSNTDADFPGCAFMGEKLVIDPGMDVIVSIVVRDPSGTNYSPYSFPNPSLAQVGINLPMNAPLLDHIDVISGLVTGYKNPLVAAEYAGAWPNTWLVNPDMSTVPAAAKNTSAALIKTFNSATWQTVPADAQFKKMTFRLRAVNASQYVRLRGTNMPPNVPFETDANGNPLADLWTNQNDLTKLRIPCATVGTNVPTNGSNFTTGLIDGCPNHLPTATSTNGTSDNPIAGKKAVAFDVAAWADLWFYSNPIYIEVRGSTLVAGVK